MTATKTTAAPTTHCRTWFGSGTAYIVDLTNAGRRGKTCRALRFRGCVSYARDESSVAADSVTHSVMRYLSTITGGRQFDADGVAAVSFDEVLETIVGIVCGADADLGDHVRCYDETIRGVDAPRPTLTAGIEGVWGGHVDNERGVSLADYTDRHNDPREITRHGQSANKAYELAAKVWDRVKLAKSMSEAGRILSDAGCALHGYCAMD